MEVTHSVRRKQIKTVQTTKVQFQQKKTEALHTTYQQDTLSKQDIVLYLTISKCGIDIIYTSRISSYQHLSFASASG